MCVSLYEPGFNDKTEGSLFSFPFAHQTEALFSSICMSLQCEAGVSLNIELLNNITWFCVLTNWSRADLTLACHMYINDNKMTDLGFVFTTVVSLCHEYALLLFAFYLQNIRISSGV